MAVETMLPEPRYALRSATQALPLTQAVAARFDAAMKAGLGGENLVAVFKLHR